MKKLNFIAGLFVLVVMLTPQIAAAVCPVCTFAVGGLLVLFESLGIPDIVFPGIWAGGLTLSLVFWTAGYMKKKDIKNTWWYVLNLIGYYVLLAMAYFIPFAHPIVKFGESTLWGIDQFLLGTILGTATFYISERWYAAIKQKNGGHAKFPFQKVVMPVVMMLILTGIFAIIIYC